MRPIKPALFYVLGTFQRLREIQSGDKIEKHQVLIGQCIALLTQFFSSADNKRELRSAFEKARYFHGFLETLLATKPGTLLTKEILERVIDLGLEPFESALSYDLDHRHIFILEEKRAYSVDTFLSQGEAVLAPGIAAYLPIFAIENIRESARCLIFDRFTASGFHIMRALEDVVRPYYEMLTHRARDRRTLGTLSSELQQLTLPERYKIIPTLLSQLCNVYRNPLSHPEIVSLDEDGAIDAFNQSINVISLMVDDVRSGRQSFACCFDWRFS